MDNLKIQKICRDCIANAMGVGWPLRTPARPDFYSDLSPRRGVAVPRRATNPGNQSQQPTCKPARAPARPRFVMPVKFEMAPPRPDTLTICTGIPAQFPQCLQAVIPNKHGTPQKRTPSAKAGGKVGEESRLLAPPGRVTGSRVNRRYKLPRSDPSDKCDRCLYDR